MRSPSNKNYYKNKINTIRVLVNKQNKPNRVIEDLRDDLLPHVWTEFGFLDFGFGHELEKYARSIEEV